MLDRFFLGNITSLYSSLIYWGWTIPAVCGVAFCIGTAGWKIGQMFFQKLLLLEIHVLGLKYMVFWGGFLCRLCQIICPWGVQNFHCFIECRLWWSSPWVSSMTQHTHGMCRLNWPKFLHLYKTSYDILYEWDAQHILVLSFNRVVLGLIIFIWLLIYGPNHIYKCPW